MAYIRHTVFGWVLSLAVVMIGFVWLTVSATAQDEASVINNETYDKETILDEAGDFLGDGAKGLGKVVERIFKDLGEPNAYIRGTEGSGAIVFGLRYGNGSLQHKIEGDQRIHWSGPSVGFDVGGNISKTFTLVYNLYDTEELFKRYPAVEGSFYFVGGIGVNYHQLGKVILVPIRLGIGLRTGVNIGYLKYTRKRKILPF